MVALVFPEADAAPGLGVEEGFELLVAEDFAADRDGFAGGANGLRKELHDTERQVGAELGLGFGDETEASGAEGGEDRL